MGEPYARTSLDSGIASEAGEDPTVASGGVASELDDDGITDSDLDVSVVGGLVEDPLTRRGARDEEGGRAGQETEENDKLHVYDVCMRWVFLFVGWNIELVVSTQPVTHVRQDPPNRVPQNALHWLNGLARAGISCSHRLVVRHLPQIHFLAAADRSANPSVFVLCLLLFCPSSEEFGANRFCGMAQPEKVVSVDIESDEEDAESELSEEMFSVRILLLVS